MILGIDPGLSGSWAILRQSSGELVHAEDMPIAGTGAQRMVSAPLLAASLKRYDITEAIIERVAARPGQGVSSMFRFGRAVGVVEGVLGCMGIPIAYVTPSRWKADARLLSPDKEQARQRAIETWPLQAASYFPNKGHHNRAEAALIALWRIRNAIGEAA